MKSHWLQLILMPVIHGSATASAATNNIPTKCDCARQTFLHRDAAAPEAKPDAAERLKQVKSLYDQGLINKDDYDKKVKEIMDSL